jgi:hypothetical protein
MLQSFGYVEFYFEDVYLMVNSKWRMKNTNLHKKDAKEMPKDNVLSPIPPKYGRIVAYI